MTSTTYIKPEVVDYGDLLELTAAARFAQVAIPLGGSGATSASGTTGPAGDSNT